MSKGWAWFGLGISVALFIGVFILYYSPESPLDINYDQIDQSSSNQALQIKKVDKMEEVNLLETEQYKVKDKKIKVDFKQNSTTSLVHTDYYTIKIEHDLTDAPVTIKEINGDEIILELGEIKKKYNNVKVTKGKYLDGNFVKDLTTQEVIDLNKNTEYKITKLSNGKGYSIGEHSTIITFSESGVLRNVIIPLSNNTFALVYQNGSAAGAQLRENYLKVYETDGDIILDETFLGYTNKGGNRILDGAPFNSDEFSVVLFNGSTSLSGEVKYYVYDTSGNEDVSVSVETSIGTDHPKVSMSNSNSTNSWFLVHNEVTTNTSLYIYNKAGVEVLGKTLIAAGLGNAAANGIACADADTCWVAYHNRTGKSVYLASYDSDGTKNCGDTFVGNVSNTGYVDLNAYNSSHVELTVMNDTDDTVVYGVYDDTCNLVGDLVALDDLSSAEPVANAVVNSTAAVNFWADGTNYISLAHESDNSNITDKTTIFSSYNAVRDVDVASQKTAVGIGFCFDRVVYAYANSTKALFESRFVNGTAWDGKCAPDPSVRVTAKDFFNDTSINSFELIVFNNTFAQHNSTTTGSINTGVKGSGYSLYIWADSYFNRSFTDVSETETSQLYSLQQSILNLTARYKVNQTTITSFNTTIAQLSNGTTTGSVRYFPNAGIQQVNATGTGLQQAQFNITVVALDNRSYPLELFTNNLTIIVRTNTTENETISNFTATLSHETFDYEEELNATGGDNASVTFDLIDELYSLQVEADGYAPKNFTLRVNQTSQGFVARLDQANKFNIRFLDEIERTLLDTLLIDLELIVEDKESRSFNTTNGTMLIDINYPEFKHTLRYKDRNNTYSERFYIITPTNNSFNNLDLYLVNLGNDTNVDVEVLDEGNDPVPNVLIKVLRYDVNTNQHVLSEMKETDFEGKARFRLVLDEEFYKFILEKDGEIKLETQPSLVQATSLVFRITLAKPVLESYYKTQDVTYSLTFDSSNNSIRYMWSDPENELERTCLTLIRSNASEINNQQVCSSTVAGVMYIAPDNITGATYKADIIVIIDGETNYIDSIYITYGEELTLGHMGWLITIFLIMVAVLGMGALSPTVMLLLTPAILLMTRLVGLNDLGYGVIMAIYVIAIAIAYIISNRS